MKRYGNIYKEIFTMENLKLAHKKRQEGQSLLQGCEEG